MNKHRTTCFQSVLLTPRHQRKCENASSASFKFEYLPRHLREEVTRRDQHPSLLEAQFEKREGERERVKKKWVQTLAKSEDSSKNRVIAARLNLVIGWALGRQYNRGPTECGVCFPAPLCSLIEYKGRE